MTAMQRTAGGATRALVYKPEWPAAPLKKIGEQRALDIASADRAIALDASRRLCGRLAPTMPMQSM